MKSSPPQGRDYDFTQLTVKKIVKLKIDENVNFDFRILENKELQFLAK